MKITSLLGVPSKQILRTGFSPLSLTLPSVKCCPWQSSQGSPLDFSASIQCQFSIFGDFCGYANNMKVLGTHNVKHNTQQLKINQTIKKMRNMYDAPFNLLQMILYLGQVYQCVDISCIVNNFSQDWSRIYRLPCTALNLLWQKLTGKILTGNTYLAQISEPIDNCTEFSWCLVPLCLQDKNITRN